MAQTTHITYLFDPLCGWCYGASSVLADLAATDDIVLNLAPTGLFAGAQARSVDEHFAAFAWSNDQRIAKQSGQVFSQDYREKVLGKRGSLLDSAAATLAMTAVFLDSPSRELEVLKLIQEARYVAGRDVTNTDTLVDVLKNAGLHDAALRFAMPDADLLAENRRRIETARTIMQGFGVNGVPALIVDDGQSKRLVMANALFGNPKLLSSLTGPRH